MTPEQAQKLQERHVAVYERYQASVQPLPGARELLQQLNRAKVPYAIATGRAYRVYQDPAELVTHLDEVGIRIVE